MRISFLSVIFAAALCFSGPAFAAGHGGHNAGTHASGAQKHDFQIPHLKEMGGKTVDTPYFRVVMPSGWTMPRPVQTKAGQGMNALFASMNKTPSISITVMRSPRKAKQIGELTLKQMQKDGITSTPLAEKEGLWHATLSGKGKGEIWFGDNKGTAAVTLIGGDNVEKADELFSALKPKVKGLFPRTVR